MDYERYEMALKNFFYFQEAQAAGENPSWFDSMLYLTTMRGRVKTKTLK